MNRFSDFTISKLLLQLTFFCLSEFLLVVIDISTFRIYFFFSAHFSFPHTCAYKKRTNGSTSRFDFYIWLVFGCFSQRTVSFSRINITFPPCCIFSATFSWADPNSSVMTVLSYYCVSVSSVLFSWADPNLSVRFLLSSYWCFSVVRTFLLGLRILFYVIYSMWQP